jgi:hypothetical protein
MKNEHLLPVNIIDIVEKFNQPNLRENERLSYQLRLETIRDYCAAAITKHNNSKPVGKPNTRAFR